MPVLEVGRLAVSFGGLAALPSVSLSEDRGEIEGIPIVGRPSHKICWAGIARYLGAEVGSSPAQPDPGA
ncbi:MAG: hypothetical protein ACE5JN_10870 [Candidatus Methylomirabilia bacterium]